MKPSAQGQLPLHYLDGRTGRARRAGQRGAAVFVVMLVVTLLTAVGLMAVRSSSLATMASGFNRQLVQTHYVADYAVLAMVGDLSSKAEVHSTNMKSGDNTQCVGYANEEFPSCALYGYNQLDQVVKKDNNQNTLLEPVVPGPPIVPGSLGPTSLEGDMRIEITDWHPAWPPLAGNDATGGVSLGYAMVTVSANGQVRPRQLVANKWDTASATAAGVEATRAHVVIGPVQMNN